MTPHEFIALITTRLNHAYYTKHPEEYDIEGISQDVTDTASAGELLSGKENPAMPRKHIVAWTGRPRQVSEDTGEVTFGETKRFKIEITSKRYIDGASKDLEDLKEPQGQIDIEQSISDIASDMQDHPGKLAWALLNAGDSTLGYDGQPFFDANHPVLDVSGKATTQQNLFLNMELNAANLDSVVQAMKAYRDLVGRKAGNMLTGDTWFTIYVRPGAVAYDTAVSLNTPHPTEQRPYAGKIAIKEADEVIGEEWYVRFSGDKAPILRVAGEKHMSEATGWESEPGRKHGRAEWVCRQRIGVALGHWQKMARCKPGA